MPKSKVQIEEILQKIRDVAHEKKYNLEEILKETVALLKNNFKKYTWVGVYLLRGDELVLGPFLGKPTPHMRIPLGKGICGAAATERKTIIVPDVNKDERYLACSLETKSEIVVPLIKNGVVLGEIDIDSDIGSAFDDMDKEMLEEVADIISNLIR